MAIQHLSLCGLILLPPHWNSLELSTRTGLSLTSPDILSESDYVQEAGQGSVRGVGEEGSSLFLPGRHHGTGDSEIPLPPKPLYCWANVPKSPHQGPARVPGTEISVFQNL